MRKRQRILRKWFWRRLGLAVFLLVAGVLLVRGAWGVLAELRLKRVQRQMAAAVTIEEAPQPEARTPAVVLMEMAGDFKPLTFRSLGFTGTAILPPLLDAPFSQLEKEKLLMVIETNEPVFARLDREQGVQKAWLVPFDRKVTGEATLGDQLRLMMDLCIARSMLEHTEGQDDAATRSLRRAMMIDRVVVMHQSLAAHQLVMYLRARVVAVVERIGPELKIHLGTTPGEPGAAAVEEVRALITSLMKDDDFQRQAGIGCREQVRALAAASPGLDERPEVLKESSVRQVNWFLRPMLIDEQRRALVKSSRWLEVVEAPSYETYRRMPWKSDDLRLSQAVMSGTGAFDAQWFRMSFAHFRAIVDARAAAVLLAARWWEVEHGAAVALGEKLIPEYLPKAAVDPFAADDRPLRYRLDTGGSSVWSVGANGTDEVGAIMAVVRGRSWEQPDLVYGQAWWVVRAGLASGPAMTAPATAPRTPPASK